MINLIRVFLFVLKITKSKRITILFNRFLLRLMLECKILENLKGEYVAIYRMYPFRIQLEITGDLKQKLIKSQIYSIIDLTSNKLIYQCRIGK